VMSVYVGPLFDTQIYGSSWKWGQACHLLADTERELHEMALRLKLKRSWFQNRNCPHYDLTASKRTKALKNGAVELDSRQEGLKLRELRLKRRTQ